MSNIKYDKQGGITSLEHDLSDNEKQLKNNKKSYNFLEKWMLKHSKKLNYLLDKQGKYKCREEKTPKVVRIGPTNLCTAQCKYCPREHIHAGGCGYMDFDLFKQIVNWAEQNKVKDISFALFGEPLIHERIFDMIELAQQKGLRVGISSNAIKMSQKYADKLISYNLKNIEMSLDGYTEDEYLEGKKVGQYRQAKKNIEYLLKRAKESNSKTRFNIHFVDAGNVSSKNKRKFVKYWSKKLEGLNYVTSFYYEPHNWAGTRADIGQNNSLLDKMLKKVELKKPCVYIKGLNIDWNGNVIICTNDPTDTAVIGNINNEKIEDIYNGEKRMKYLEAHETGDFRKLNCSKCNVNSYWPLLFIKKRIVNYFSR